jgi:feruloyl esterase
MKAKRVGQWIAALSALCLIVCGPAAVPQSGSPKAKVDAQIAGGDCTALARIDFRGIPEAPTAIASARIVPRAGPNLEYCEVKGVIAPQIGFELRLPTKSWNGRYFQTGCGFFCGVVDIAACGDAQAKDFAVAAQNMGHSGASQSDAIWGMDPALRADFGKRSTHVTAVVSKAIITAYYGQRPAYAYYRGCSTGGREGLSEAHFYPDDFDGVIAGDPAFPGRQGGVANVWDTRQLTRRDGSDVFSPAKLKLLNSAVLEACDALDGLKDGIITDPRACRFNVTGMRCKGADGPDCLTAEQVAAAVELYAGPHDSRGRKLTPGHRLFGSERAWESGSRAPIADGYLRYLAFEQNPPGAFTIWDLDFDKDIRRLEPMAAAYDPVAPYAKPDLKGFEARGGKLILYHGFADPTVSPLNTIDFYAWIAAADGGMDRTRGWARLFMIPGMFHCRGGDAPNTFDVLEPMMRWVEKGEAPERIILVQKTADGQTVRTRPAFPYPAAPRYAGKGDVNDQANFAMITPSAAPDDRVVDWIWAPR